MLIDIKTLVGIVVGMAGIMGGIIAFFVMQNTQNMKIKGLEDRMDSAERKQTTQTGYQIETEKNVLAINGKLDHILEAIAEIKAGRCK